MSTDATTTADDRSLFATMRERLAARPDSEHAQAFIRLAIAVISLIYVLFMDSAGKLVPAQQHIIFFIAFYAALSAVGLFVVIASRPVASPPRRFLGMVFDLSGTSYFMYVLEGIGILFFPVYLWVTIGYGLRYGARYLYAAMAIAIIAFTIVFVSSPYWGEQWGFSMGLLVGLVALPLYFSILLRQLSKQHAELKQLYEQMARHATHDSLTNLPNRKHFYDQLAEAITIARQEGRSFAVLYLDLDGFKTINDDLGHVAGDQLIERTARRIERCVRKADMVARVGGDEFVVILSDIDPSNATKVAGKIIESLAEPFVISGKTLNITTSIGIATYPQDGGDVNALIHSADSAMYEAKRNGKNGYRIYLAKNSPFVPVSISGRSS
jgi:diguanylate cyclase (GGDEF)-like protein